ncbi:hypothetical protein BJ875DRAFT_462044 [Amylocarpus encephaloides]|uniref:Uncharacterized protein n=1 Tax=Amylocarpus encephaloides TaxID=45428 RepID=A0A9P7YIU9_9HELO|nr:hypothetical protein BJ875DRAFT_462044 [Amylocarpus encephaloides]
MPKHKQFLKEPKHKSKHAQQLPSTPDECLAAGVDLEEAGEKWRGGDAAKSMRFFQRALGCYEEGLTTFPASFDLAYNLARLQYQITQHPKLLKELPADTWTLSQLLQTALASSRRALDLKMNEASAGEDADALFNTGQILTSLAEELNAKNPYNVESDQASCGLLEEAVGLFQRCLVVQEGEYTEFQRQIMADLPDTSSPSNVNAQDGSPTTTGTIAERPEKIEQWVSVREEVTKDDILDTFIAFVQALSTLCNRSSRLERDADKFLHTVESFAGGGLINKLQLLARDTAKQIDAAIAAAGLMSAVSEAKYRLGLPGNDFKAYSENVQHAWSKLELKQHAQGLWNRSEAYITASQALSDHDGSLASQITKVQWTLYSLAAADLTSASSFRDDENIGKIFLVRGDVELLRAGLGRPHSIFEMTAKTAETLVRNAEKYYRGAKNLSQGEDTWEEFEEAVVKETLAKAMLGDSKELKDVRTKIARADEILQEALVDGLFVESMLEVAGS